MHPLPPHSGDSTPTAARRLPDWRTDRQPCVADDELRRAALGLRPLDVLRRLQTIRLSARLFQLDEDCAVLVAAIVSGLDVPFPHEIGRRRFWRERRAFAEPSAGAVVEDHIERAIAGHIDQKIVVLVHVLFDSAAGGHHLVPYAYVI